MTEYLPHLPLAWSVQLTGPLSPGPGVATARGRAPALPTFASCRLASSGT